MTPGTFVRVDRDAWDELDHRFDAADVEVAVRWTLFRLFRLADFRTGFVSGSSRDLARRLGMGPVAFRSHRRILVDVGALRVAPARNQWTPDAGLQIVDYVTLVEGGSLIDPATSLHRPSNERVVGRSSTQQGSLIDPAQSPDQRKRPPKKSRSRSKEGEEEHGATRPASVREEVAWALRDFGDRIEADEEITYGHVGEAEALRDWLEEEAVVMQVEQETRDEMAREGVASIEHLDAVRVRRRDVTDRIHRAGASWPGGLDHVLATYRRLGLSPSKAALAEHQAVLAEVEAEARKHTPIVTGQGGVVLDEEAVHAR